MTIVERNTSTALTCDCKRCGACHVELLAADEDTVVEKASLLGWPVDGPEFEATCPDCLRGNCPSAATAAHEEAQKENMEQMMRAVPVPMVKVGPDGKKTVGMSTIGEVDDLIAANGGKMDDLTGDGQGEAPGGGGGQAQAQSAGPQAEGQGEGKAEAQGEAQEGSGEGQGEAGDSGGEASEDEGGEEQEAKPPPPPLEKGSMPGVTVSGQDLRTPDEQLDEEGLDELEALFQKTSLFGVRNTGWSPNGGN